MEEFEYKERKEGKFSVIFQVTLTDLWKTESPYISKGPTTLIANSRASDAILIMIKL